MNSPHILLVDDDVMTSAVLREYLETLRYTVSQADNCKEAAEALSGDTKIDLMILDYMMPDENGTELLRLIARRRDLQRPPVIMASSLIDPNHTDWQKLFKTLAPDAQSLVHAFVTKPFAFETLEILLTDTLKIRTVQTNPPQALAGDYFPLPSAESDPPQ